MAAALVLASLWIVSRGGMPPQQAADAAAVSSHRRRPPPDPPRRPVTPAPAPPLVAAPTPAPPTLVRSLLALTLSPISTRSGEQATHVGPAGPVDLVLRLEGTADTSDRTYDAELQTVDGRRGVARSQPCWRRGERSAHDAALAGRQPGGGRLRRRHRDARPARSAAATCLRLRTR